MWYLVLQAPAAEPLRVQHAKKAMTAIACTSDGNSNSFRLPFRVQADPDQHDDGLDYGSNTLLLIENLLSLNRAGRSMSTDYRDI